MNKPVSTELTVGAKSKLENLKTFLLERKEALKGRLPPRTKSEALVNQALKYVSRSPQLLTCSTLSIYTAMTDAADLGLEPFNPQHLAYIIPYKNKHTGQFDAKFIPSFRGLLELARRTGTVLSADSGVIHQNDTFEIERGLQQKLRHIPNYLIADRGPEILVYAVIHFVGGGFQFDVMTIQEIEYIRSKSKSPNHGPWVDFWGEMAKKTVLKRVLKTCPCAIDTEAGKALLDAIEKDNTAEYSHEHIEFIDVENIETVETAPTKAQELISKLEPANG